MGDIAKKIAEARDHVSPAWTPARERAVKAKVDARLGARPRARLFTLAIALCTVLIGFVAWQRLGTAPRVATNVSPAHEAASLPLLQFEDGSTATRVSPEARVEPIEVGPTVVAVRLASGAARFSVTPNPGRKFRVAAGNVTVTVLGTIFTVALESSGVRVGVERGRVRVEWPAGERELAVGEQFLVENAPWKSPEGDSDVRPPPAPLSGPVDASAPVGERTAKNGSRTPDEPSWRTLAQDGDYVHAFARMTNQGANAIHDEPSDLLLAADVARLGGHPEKAVAKLERVVTAHADDSRAPLAAFTLGRTLLDQLGRPREAAQAFATARRLDQKGALAQDALAREVEGWSRAGEASLSHERAEQYVTAYPKGRRLAAVKRLGGLE